jgi:hypothetical protein
MMLFDKTLENVVFCRMCNEEIDEFADTVTCDDCGHIWHEHCLDFPGEKPQPQPKKKGEYDFNPDMKDRPVWRCPLHVINEIRLSSHPRLAPWLADGPALRTFKLRQLKDAEIVSVSAQLTRGSVNNGLIEVETDDEPAMPEPTAPVRWAAARRGRTTRQRPATKRPPLRKKPHQEDGITYKLSGEDVFHDFIVKANL